jgi:hypothetical protein
MVFRRGGAVEQEVDVAGWSMARNSDWSWSASPEDPVRRNASVGGAGPAEATP